MSDPYRDGGYRDAAEAPQERGIVGDVIAQFADPYAFYRELVQNAIDAGSPEVDVELTYDEGAQKLHVSVRDRGEGMTREILENQLLVLFRSTKEKDSRKIGKFGVGFASVLAANPDVVIVQTARDGKRLTLHLYRDLTYELFDAGRASQTGTSVELEIPLPRDQIATFEMRSELALRRWCRHASVPIHVELGRGDQRKRSRIDEPLGITDAVVAVRASLDDGALTIIAGLSKTGARYLGFFNHGLSLHETDASPFGAVSVKIQDSRLGHTISRDDVRRDAHYRRALAAARDVVKTQLAAAAESRLRELAETGTPDGYGELVAALVASPLELDSWHFPLVEPIGGKRTVASGDVPRQAWGAPHGTALTEALAAAGVPVVRREPGGAVDQALARLGRRISEAHSWLTAVRPIDELTEHDQALVTALRVLLDAAHRAPDDIVLVDLVGSRDHHLAISIDDAGDRVVGDDDANKNPFALFGRRVLALSVRHSHVEAARKGGDAVLAASHLARAVLLHWGALDAKRSRALLDRALDELGVGS